MHIERAHLTSCRCYSHDTLGCISIIKGFFAQWIFIAVVSRVASKKMAHSHIASPVSSFHCKKVAVLVAGLCSDKIGTCSLCPPVHPVAAAIGSSSP